MSRFGPSASLPVSILPIVLPIAWGVLLASSAGAQVTRWTGSEELQRHPGFSFIDVSAACGMLPFAPAPGMASGAAAADYDGDGDIDVMLPTGNGLPNRLYRNDGTGGFTDVASLVGLAETGPWRGALWLDVEGDGDLDLFLANDFLGATSSFALYLQRDDGTFVDGTVAAGLKVLVLNAGAHRGGLAAGDVNLDGYLDIYAASWSHPCNLFLNQGDGTFVDVAAASGLHSGLVDHRQWQPMFADLNGDGWQDIYVAVDHYENFLWINQQDGTFVDIAALSGTDIIMHDMGMVIVDYDDDGDFDLYTSNIFELDPGEHNALLRNDSAGGSVIFTDVSREAGLADGGWGWGITALDVDLDGDLDFAGTNGFTGPYTDDRSRFWLRNRESPKFVEMGEECGVDDTLWGSALLAFDMDRDGDLDLFQNTIEGEILMLENRPDLQATSQGGSHPVSPNRHWLVVRPRSSGPNSHAIGAVVTATVGGRTMTRLISAGTSLLGQEPAEAHFGLGSHERVERVEVRYLDGTVRVLNDVRGDRVITVY